MVNRAISLNTFIYLDSYVRLNQIERQISKYIQENLTFCVFRMDNKEQRLFCESKIASTLAQSKELRPSSGWLGNYSPKEKIRASGLWQVNGLEGACLNEQEIPVLRRLILFQRK